MFKSLGKLTFSPWDNPQDQNNSPFSVKSPIDFSKFKGFNFFNTRNPLRLALLFCLIMALGWLSSGIYTVQEGEEAIIMRFGRIVRKSHAGLNYHLPMPIERVIIARVNQSRRLEIGYRSTSGSHTTQNARGQLAESIMLTGDENIVELNCDVMWHIKDLEEFAMRVADPEETIKAVIESAIREIIAQTPIASVLSNQKQEIATHIQELGQRILDQYHLGAEIDQVQLLKAEPPAEVIDSYRDVQTARADKEREINQAQAYSNDILPRARGQAAEIIQSAEGYKQELQMLSEGETKRFMANYREYVKNPQLTKDRLYLERMEEIMKLSKKTITNSGVLPHMSIDKNAH